MSGEILIQGSIAVAKADFPSLVEVFAQHVANSRCEPGNLSFDMFCPEDGSPNLLFVERWRDHAAIDAHFSMPSLADLGGFLDRLGAIRSPAPFYAQVPPYGDSMRRLPTSHVGSRNVLANLTVAADRVGEFQEAWQELVPHSRDAKGNAVLELYKSVSDPCAYFLFERWDTAGDHEKVLAAPATKQFEKRLGRWLAEPMVDGKNRFLSRGL